MFTYGLSSSIEAREDELTEVALESSSALELSLELSFAGKCRLVRDVVYGKTPSAESTSTGGARCGRYTLIEFAKSQADDDYKADDPSEVIDEFRIPKPTFAAR